SRPMAVCRSVISRLVRSSGLFTTLMMRAESAASLPITLLSAWMLMSGSSAASRTRRATSGRVGRTSSSFSMAWISSAWTFSASLLIGFSVGNGSALDFAVTVEGVGQLQQAQGRTFEAAEVDAPVCGGILLEHGEQFAAPFAAGGQHHLADAGGV